MTKPLRIALTKGRLEKDTVGLLEKLGYDCEAVHNKGRRLILPIPDGNMEVVLSKAADVITYVEHGVCDLGVVGKDTILEMSGKFFELADLGFGKCRLHWQPKRERIFTADMVSSALQPSIQTLHADSLKARVWMLTL